MRHRVPTRQRPSSILKLASRANQPNHVSTRWTALNVSPFSSYDILGVIDQRVDGTSAYTRQSIIITRQQQRNLSQSRARSTQEHLLFGSSHLSLSLALPCIHVDTVKRLTRCHHAEALTATPQLSISSHNVQQDNLHDTSLTVLPRHITRLTSQTASCYCI
jgi:hypothetical protein